MFGTEKPKADLEFFTIYDSKVGVYREPVLAMNQFDVVRQFQNMFTDPSQNRNPYYLNPEDFQIFKIGDFCKKTAKINWHQPEHVVSLHELKTKINTGGH
ncbi:MAG: nonstructural protein [Arizlama microvirus]|nr:MAG: nonstructural protein [Arizlama microvirus]